MPHQAAVKGASRIQNAEHYSAIKQNADPKGDEDKDKINNIDERDKYKTDMLSNDTDKDGISDYDEIFVYKTNPLKSDTDGDGISDYDEILSIKQTH